MYAEVCYVEAEPTIAIQREAIPVEEFDYFGPFQARPIDRSTPPHLLRFPFGVVGDHFQPVERIRIWEFLQNGEAGDSIEVKTRCGMRYRVGMFAVGDGIDLTWKSL